VAQQHLLRELAPQERWLLCPELSPLAHGLPSPPQPSSGLSSLAQPRALLRALSGEDNQCSNLPTPAAAL
jgi:hypothetical protein